ncbi:Shikimate kinase 2 [Rubripirellula amarantea]|uniref:Shikimate kinase n=1 Tax=Rubripirellula amarantea TaxID=2527999 RepID=A0A5C5WKG9_9BACT|nr:shikimate kinase [Rubripirellula amarantea]TWT51264.1 Shikimate kinase 2 [Rubripirellula amarantea]
MRSGNASGTAIWQCDLALECGVETGTVLIESILLDNVSGNRDHLVLHELSPEPSPLNPAPSLAVPVYLTGYRASGKTSVAKRLGEQLGVPVIDLDAEIVSSAKASIAEIFSQSGEAGFRDLETEQLRRFAERVSGREPRAIIVSLGGGAILREVNRAVIAKSGPCVWLDADTATIIGRLRKDSASSHQRPGLTDLPLEQEVENLLATRRPLYQQVSQLRIDTSDLSIEEICRQIVDWLGQNHCD